MASEYDIVIIRGGPNGLEIGAYLSKAWTEEQRKRLRCETISLSSFGISPGR